MSNDIDLHYSTWWVSLLEFSEEVLLKRRKRLGLSQQDVGRQCGLSQSEISRYENGLAKPKDVPTLEVLCRVYKLRPAERQRYISLATGTISPQSTYDPDPVVGLLKNQVEFIAYTNRVGNPKVAIEQADLVTSWLEGYFDRNFLQKPKIRELMSLILLEKSAAWWDIVEPNEVDEYTTSIFNQMDKVTESISEGNIDSSLLYLEVNKGFHHYVKGNYKDAESIFNFVMRNADLINEDWKVEVIRASTVTKGKLGDITGLNKNINLIHNYVSQNIISNQNKAYLLEGLGRSLIGTNTELGLNYLRDSSGLIIQASKEPKYLEIRFIQHRRSFVDALKAANSPHKVLVDVASPALRKAKKHGFTRHFNQIRENIHL